MNSCNTQEPRGARHLLAGICTICGTVTIHRNPKTQRPQHQPKPEPPKEKK